MRIDSVLPADLRRIFNNPLNLQAFSSRTTIRNLPCRARIAVNPTFLFSFLRARGGQRKTRQICI
jgi:hypothetical protein